MKKAPLRYIYSLSLFFLSLFNIYGQSSDEPPVIIAVGDQFYCPLSELNVATEFSISGPEDLIIDAFYIQITTGYQNGDLLQLNANTTELISSWNSLTGKLTLTKPGENLSYEEINEAVKNVVYLGNDPNYSGEKYFSFTIGNANFLPSTGHFYEFVPDIGITWTLARTLAEGRNYYGLPGYLATITSSEEAQLSGEQADGAGWIGGSDAEQEGTWKWVTGPEQGDIFWIGLADGSAPNGAYEFWNTGEPNNLGDEDYAHVTAPNVGITGSWNDLSVTGADSGDYQPKGYIVEYGYGGPQDAPIFSAFTRVYTNRITEVTNGTKCGPGNVILSAKLNVFEDQTAATEIVWFDSEDSDIPLWTGETFNPDLEISTTYYVLASQNECYKGERKEVTASIYDIPIITDDVTLKNCDADDIPNDGFTDFNLREADVLINNGDLTLTLSYYLTEEDAISGLNQIDPPFFNNREADLIYGRAESLDACYAIARVNLEVSATNPLDVMAVLESCDDDDVNDGKFKFDLTEASAILLESLPQQNLIIQYYRSQNDAALKINEILPQSDYINETPYEQNLFTRIESLDNGECVSVGQYVQLRVYALPEFDLEEEDVYCQNIGTLTLSVMNPDGNYAYQWMDASGNIIGTETSVVISSAGTYSVVATSDLNCKSKQRTIEVKESSIATITQEDIDVIDGGEQNSIAINTDNLGVGSYEYALDDRFGSYQDEPFFDNVLPGEHILYVRDKNECGIADIRVFVIGYMKFFTPNGDGYNDTWQVLGVASQPMSLIYIYDKFGKLLAQLDASNEEGWDGIYNGKQLPSADYWYRVQLEDGRIHTGHFSLIRR